MTYGAISNTVGTLNMSPKEGRWFIHSFASWKVPEHRGAENDCECVHTFVDNCLDYHISKIYYTHGNQKPPQVQNIEYIQKYTTPLTNEQIDYVKLLNTPLPLEYYSNDELILRELYKAYSASVEEFSIGYTPGGGPYQIKPAPMIEKGDCERRRKIFDTIITIQERRYKNNSENIDIRNQLLTESNVLNEKLLYIQKENEGLMETITTIKKENNDLKEAIKRLEYKMGMIMEFMLMMK